MTGDPAAEEVEADRAAGAATGGRRPDGELLGGLSATAADVIGSRQLHSGQQNGVSGNSARMNPFYAYALESSGKGHLTEDVGRKTSEENFGTLFVPPPEFQSSPLDLHTEMKGLENGGGFSEKDLFQTRTPNSTQGLFQTSTLAPNASANGQFHDLTLNSPDLFKPNPAQTRNLSKPLQSASTEPLKDGVSLFQAAKGEDLLRAEPTREVNLFDKSPAVFEDPFKSPVNKDDDLFRPPRPAMASQFDTPTANVAGSFGALPANSGPLFNITANKQEDLSNLDIFSPSSTNAVNPFPSPVARDLFQSLDDPFGTTPSKQQDSIQDVSNSFDIFQPLPSTTNSNAFDINSSNTASKATPSTPAEMNMPSSPDLFKAAASESGPAPQPNSDRPLDVVLTSPQGTKHDILQPSPFTRARNLSMSPRQLAAEISHVPTIKRPPRPLPRTRPPVKEKPPRPEKPPAPAKSIGPEPTVPKTSPKPVFRSLPKPVFPRKPKTLESKPTDPENYVVFEDILLIGQERCVEDWPEDSPQLNPDFKPSGKLRLRRESMILKTDSDGGSGEDQDGPGSNDRKRDRKFRMSVPFRRDSKEKFADDMKEGRSRTLPNNRSLKEYFSDMTAGETEDGDQNGMDYKKRPLKAKVDKLFRRASTTSSVPEGSHMNGHLPQDSKNGDNKKSIGKKNSIIRRWSEGTVLDGSTGEEEDGGGEAQYEEKKKKKMKIKFVPQRGFAITVEKKDDEAKGAHGYTPRKGSKDKSQDEVLGAYGYTPRKKSQDDAFEDVEELKARSLQSTGKAAFMDDELFHSAGLNGDEDPYGGEDCKPKKPTTMKLLHGNHRKEDTLDFSALKKKSSFSAEELDDDELCGTEDCKPKKPKHKPLPFPRKHKTASGESEPAGCSQDVFDEDDVPQKGKDFLGPGELYDSEDDDVDICKAKKPNKLKAFMKQKRKAEFEDPPGAASDDFLSEAARAEWLAAQKDKHAIEGLEDDGDGDTDSLMEWWNTVEQWDELPSDAEDEEEDESKSFSILADKVYRGLRVFNKVFTERAEDLWQSVITLHAIADNIKEYHQKAKIAKITGSTTTAVGGVAAVAGLALIPVTFGASLIITAVGVGVATAGGITSASATISDNVNSMNDRKKMEILLEEYETQLLKIAKILHFANQGLYKLRGHPFLRSGTQHYSKDWEIRRAVQMISMVDQPVMQATGVIDSAVAAVQGLFKGMNEYFIKDSRELKKGCTTEVVGQMREVANVLNDGVVELNGLREEIQDAIGET